MTQTAIGVRWDPSSDNVGVAGYRLYRNGTLVATTTGTTYSVGGLACGTSYAIGLAAIDAAGNESNRAEATGTRSTAACDPVPTPTPSPTPTPTPTRPDADAEPHPTPTPTPTPSPTPTPTPSPTPTPTPDADAGPRRVALRGRDRLRRGRLHLGRAVQDVRACLRGRGVGRDDRVAAGRYPVQNVPSGSKAVTFKGSSGVLVDQLWNDASGLTYDGINIDGRFVRKQTGLQLNGNNVTFKNAEVGNLADEKNIVRGDGQTFDNVRFHDVVMTPTGESEGLHMECLYSLASNLTIKNSRFENCAVMDLFLTRGTLVQPARVRRLDADQQLLRRAAVHRRPVLPLLLGAVGVAVQVRPGGAARQHLQGRRRRAGHERRQHVLHQQRGVVQHPGVQPAAASPRRPAPQAVHDAAAGGGLDHR